jgi:predicted ATPase
MPFGPVTGIFGANSSGKTSIIQFLLLLKQTKEATDRAIVLELNGSYLELGSIRDAVHKHDLAKEISWVLSFWPPDWPPEMRIVDDASNPHPQDIITGNTLELISRIGVDNQKLVPRSLAYQFGDSNFELSPQAERPLAFDLKASTVEGGKARFEFKRTVGRPWSLPGPIKSYGFPDRARTSFQNAAFLADLEAGYEEQMNRIFYLGPLRDFPRRDYLWTRSRPTDVGRRGEKAIDAILAATEASETRKIKRKGRGMPFQRMVAHWLHEMGLIDSFSVKEIAVGSNRWQAHVKTRSGASDVLLPDVGFGVSQVLPVVTLLQYVPEGSTVILEQPEIHLHPLAQANLADVIINAATTRKVQVLIESHSEHLLLRLQRRIAEAAISANEVKLYFCDAPLGVSQLTQLEIDLFGNISNWPKNFMGDAFGETAEAERARLNRMKAAQ